MWTDWDLCEFKVPNWCHSLVRRLSLYHSGISYSPTFAIFIMNIFIVSIFTAQLIGCKTISLEKIKTIKRDVKKDTMKHEKLKTKFKRLIRKMKILCLQSVSFIVLYIFTFFCLSIPLSSASQFFLVCYTFFPL